MESEGVRNRGFLILEAKVVPDSKEFRISASPGKLVVRVRESAEKGKANRELVAGLERLLGCHVRILRGHTGRRKTLELSGIEEDELGKRLGVEGQGQKAPQGPPGNERKSGDCRGKKGQAGA